MTAPAGSGGAGSAPAVELVTSYLAAFSSGDPVEIARHVAPSFVNDHASSLGAGCEGRDTYLERLPSFLAALADLRYEPLEVIAAPEPDGGDRVAVIYRLTAVSDGHPIDLRGAMFFHVRDGLIARRTDVWDSLTYLHQTGASD